jgi:hypothetical protein
VTAAILGFAGGRATDQRECGAPDIGRGADGVHVGKDGANAPNTRQSELKNAEGVLRCRE